MAGSRCPLYIKKSTKERAYPMKTCSGVLSFLSKIKIFLWQMAKGRFPSNAQINRRHGAAVPSVVSLR
jgi:hypothetical protein